MIKTGSIIIFVILANIIIPSGINGNCLYAEIQPEIEQSESNNTFQDDLSIDKSSLSKSGEGSNILRNFAFDLGFLLAKPQEEFGENIKNLGYGINLSVGYAFKPYPLLAGISVDGLTLGSETNRIPFSYYSDLVTLEQNTSNNIFMLHLLLRIQPHRGIFRPYLDILYGFKYLYTETSIRDDNYFNDDDDVIASSINLEDYAASKGLGGGLKIRVKEWSDDIFAPDKGSLCIYLRSRYLWGNNAEYLNVKKEGWIEVSDPEDGPVSTKLYPDNSRTDMLTWQIGISIVF